MRALVVGAGSVGQVFARHLSLGGAEVSFLVKEKHVAELRGGLTLYPLNRKQRKQPVRFEGFGVVTSAAEAAQSHWDQIYLSMSSTGLRAGSWLEELAPATRSGTLVSLLPGVHDGAYIAARIDPARIVSGLISFISYHAPLPSDTGYPEPGMAYWFPPFSPSPFSGPPALVAPVVAALKAGGMPATTADDVPRLSIYPGALFAGHIASLEAADWSFAKIRRGNYLALATQASREAMAVGAAEIGGKPPFLLRLLVRPFTVKLALIFGPLLFPFDLETYTRVHFTKVGDQMRLSLPQYIESGKRHGVGVAGLEQLAKLLPPVATRSTAA
jgi:ketopantoate reductase